MPTCRPIHFLFNLSGISVFPFQVCLLSTAQPHWQSSERLCSRSQQEIDTAESGTKSAIISRRVSLKYIDTSETAVWRGSSFRKHSAAFYNLSMNWMLLPNYEYIENILGQSGTCFLNGAVHCFCETKQVIFNYEISVPSCENILSSCAARGKFITSSLSQ